MKINSCVHMKGQPATTIIKNANLKKIKLLIKEAGAEGLNISMSTLGQVKTVGNPIKTAKLLKILKTKNLVEPFADVLPDSFADVLPDSFADILPDSIK